MFIAVYILNHLFLTRIDIIHTNVYHILIGKLILTGKISKYCWPVFISCLVYDLIISEKNPKSEQTNFTKPGDATLITLLMYFNSCTLKTSTLKLSEKSCHKMYFHNSYKNGAMAYENIKRYFSDVIRIECLVKNHMVHRWEIVHDFYISCEHIFGEMDSH